MSSCTPFRFAQSTSGTASSSTCDRSCARRRATRPQGCAGRRTRWASRTVLETSPRAGHAGVVEEVGTATLLLVVAPRRMVVAVVLRARKEVELERHAVGRHIVAMLVGYAHATAARRAGARLARRAGRPSRPRGGRRGPRWRGLRREQTKARCARARSARTRASEAGEQEWVVAGRWERHGGGSGSLTRDSEG